MIAIFLKANGKRWIEFSSQSEDDFRLIAEKGGTADEVERIVPLVFPDDDGTGVNRGALEILLKLDTLTNDDPVHYLVGELISFGYRLGMEDASGVRS